MKFIVLVGFLCLSLLMFSMIQEFDHRVRISISISEAAGINIEIEGENVPITQVPIRTPMKPPGFW